MNIPHTIRGFVEGDAPIVYDSWLRSMADELDITNPDERRRYVRAQKPVVDVLLVRGVTLVAVSRIDSALVLGWACFELPDVLHFVFVKKPNRRGRLASELIKASGLPSVCRASHFTSWGFPRVARLFEGLSHDPTLGAL